MSITPQDERILKLAKKASAKNDKLTALKYYLKAAEKGIVPAMLECGCIYFEGKGGVEKNIDESLKWFQNAAEHGNPIAMNNMGYIFGILNRQEEAIFWYEKAAQLNDFVAMLNLSEIYRGKLQNKTLANYWLKKAESIKSTAALRKVAEYYTLKEIGKNPIDKAIKLYRQAIDLGDFAAYKELGDLFFALNDIENAHASYMEGANVGNVACMVELGAMLIYVPNAFRPAHYWLSEAISQGNVYAMQVIGELYEEYKDYPKALRWYRKAALNGINDAAESLSNIKKLLKKHKPDHKLKSHIMKF